MDKTNIDEVAKQAQDTLNEVMERVQSDTRQRDARRESGKTFGLALMILAVFVVVAAGLPVPVDLSTRVILGICALVLLVVGAWYIDRAKVQTHRPPPTAPAHAPEPLRRVK